MPDPPTVYLDSSDYSNLASAAEAASFADRARWLAIRDQLSAARSQGHAVFRFSYPIVMEIYPSRPEDRAHALARARAVVDTCGPRCLLDFTTLFAEEAQAVALDGDRLPRVAAWRNDAAWHPDPDEVVKGLTSDFAQTIAATAEQMLKDETRLSRAARRSLLRRVITKDGALTREWVNLLGPDQRQAISLGLAERLNLPPEMVAEDVPARALLGELPMSAIAECMTRMLRDIPTLFVQQAAIQHEGQLFHWIRRLGSGFAEPLREARRELLQQVNELGLAKARELAEQAGEPPFARAWISRLRPRMLESLWRLQQRRWAAQRISRRHWEMKVVASEAGMLPALDALLLAAREHVLDALRPSAQPRQPRDSDGGDLVHMLYMPYVDVFRCDGYAARTARRVADRLGLSTQVAGTPAELMALLDRQLAASAGKAATCSAKL